MGTGMKISPSETILVTLQGNNYRCPFPAGFFLCPPRAIISAALPGPGGQGCANNYAIP